MMDCDALPPPRLCGYAGFPPLAGEMSEGQRGREGLHPSPLMLKGE